MTTAATSWADLQNALLVHEPLCDGDDRFVAETGEHDAALRKICSMCPVMERCRAFAQTAPRNGTWGFYGGIVRRTTPQVRPRRRASVSVRD